MCSVMLKSLQGILLRRNVCNVLSIQVPQKYFSAKLNNPVLLEEETKKKRKTDPIPKITLLSPEDNISVLTLEEAQKISKRRDLKLVKIIDLDTKTQRPVYKLMTAEDYLAEELKQREERKKEKHWVGSVKGEKLLFINSSISDHDLQIHAKKILRWIAKKFEVRIVINGNESDMSKAEKVYKLLETNIGSNARFVQKRTKSGDIKFQIIPLKENIGSGGGGKD